MAETRNIVLVGFMGTGKTSVGKLLAWRNNMKFVDMDDVIRQRTGKPIPRIFSEDGEAHFRTLERALVVELSAQSGTVIATGGGIVLNPANMADFSRSGVVICLHASPEAILRRAGGNADRPLLEGDDKMKKIVEILEARKHLYNAITRRIDTSDLTVEEVADKVMSLYGA
jgi:shikimate kinase